MKTEVKVLKIGPVGSIQCFKWVDESIENYKGVVLISHGMAEHIERYESFAQKLTADGFVVVGHNQRGHKGSISSKDDYGYMSDEDNFNILVTDLYRLTEILKEEYPNLPIFVFGHSMGSFVTQRFAQLYGNKVDGIILSGSAKQPTILLNIGVILASTISTFRGRRYRSKLLNKLTFDANNKYFKPNRTKFDWLNRDEKEVDKYIADEYCGGIFTAAFYKDFFKGLKAISQNFILVPKDLPIFLISGSMDPVGGCTKFVNNLYKKLSNMEIKDLTLKLYDNARHEILLETNKEEVITDCINWLNEHVK